jgi:cephalosporin-C deacetylase
MANFDLPLNELTQYRPRIDEPRDFDDFWSTTLAAAREAAFVPRFERIETGLESVETYDVTFSGYAGQAIKAWYLLPKARDGNIPCVVEFIGYGGGRNLPTEWLLWASAGYAHFVMDTRGQGSGWSQGDTPDIQDIPSGPEFSGFMTRGILDPATYFYRRVFADAVRAVETAAARPEVDTDRMAVTGGSQGGGIAIAVAGLSGKRVLIAMPDIPFLCHYRRAIDVIDSDPYGEIKRWCMSHRDQASSAFQTLAYFDGLSFAPRAVARALFSVGLMDPICPPSTVFAAYNAWGAEKDIRIYPFNQHEGGGPHQTREKLAFAKKFL